MSDDTTVDFLVVGAGITGLMAARTLRERGSTLLLEKESCVGGRMATQPIGPGLADLGAQFFTVRTPDFRALCQEWLSADLVTPWATGWSDASLSDITPETYPRYIAKGGMIALAEHLALHSKIETDVELEAVLPSAGGWLARTRGGQIYRARALLLTPPVPQSLALLSGEDAILSGQDRSDLERVSYASVVVGLFSLAGSPRLPGLGAVQMPQGPIRFLVDNQRKGISPGATTLTVQASENFSRELWSRPDSDILRELRNLIQPYLKPEITVQESFLKRWLYAMAVVKHPEPYLPAAGLPPLIFAGDGFGAHPGIEGAVLSGVASGRELARML